MALFSLVAIFESFWDRSGIGTTFLLCDMGWWVVVANNSPEAGMCDIQILDSIPISIFRKHDFEFNININIEGMPVSKSISKSISILIFGEGPFRIQYQYQCSKNVYFKPISISIINIDIFDNATDILLHKDPKKATRGQNIQFLLAFQG